MTIKEYITTTLSKFQISEGEIDVILLNQNLDGGETITASGIKDVETAIYNEFSSLIPVMDISEGGLSIKWNIPALMMWYSLLAKKLGKEDVLASLNATDDSVNNASFYW